MPPKTDVLQSLKFNLKILGFKEDAKHIGLRVYVFWTVLSCVIVNMFFFLLSKWNVLSDRVSAMKTLTFLMTYVVISTSIASHRREVSSVFSMFKDLNYKPPYHFSHDRETLMAVHKEKIMDLNRFWWILVIDYVAALNVIPIIIGSIKFLYLSESFQEIIKQTHSTPYPLYYPKIIGRSGTWEPTIDVCVYLISYVSHSFCMIVIGLYAHFVYTTPLCAMTCVQYELKLLRLSLEEMEHYVKQAGVSDETNEEYQDLNDTLRKFSHYVIRHHQDIYRRYAIVNRGIRWIAGAKCLSASIYFCLSINAVVEKSQLILIAREILFLGISAYAFYLFNSCGEKVKTEADNLRNAFYECAWLEKPNWFKTTLLLAMTRSSKQVEFQPFGLITLNLNTFAMTIKAAYSYYNLLHNFKK